MLRQITSSADLANENYHWLDNDGIGRIAALVRESGIWLIIIDGFTGAGKSTIAEMLAAELGCKPFHLDDDDFRVADVVGDYIGDLDPIAVGKAIEESVARKHGVFDGILMEQFLDKFVPNAQPFRIYASSVAVNDDDNSITWLDFEAATFEDYRGIGSRIELEVAAYHQLRRPHREANVFVVRDVDMGRHIDDFQLSNGAKFKISSDVWRASGIGRWRSFELAFNCDDKKAAKLMLSDVVAPDMSATPSRLSDDRMLAVLRGIAAGDSLPPIVVYREPGSDAYILLDGARRLYASVAVRFVKIPALEISRDEAETSYNYPYGQQPLAMVMR